MRAHRSTAPYAVLTPSVKMLAISFMVLCLASARADVSETQIASAYKRALAGNKQAVEECITLLEAAVQQEPASQLARVYLGSAYTLRSRDMGFGPRKLSTLKQGLSVMDAAVAAAPDQPQVRLVRALTTDSLPFFLGRKKSTADDFHALANIAQRAPEKFTAEDLQIIAQHRRALDSSSSSR